MHREHGRLGIDVWQVRELANRHPRVSILEPGAGVGGHCIAVDPWFIFHSAPEEARLIRTARTVNGDKPQRVVMRVIDLAARFKTPVIACYGITKPDVDVMRESPALEIVEALVARPELSVLVCEPNLSELPASLAGHSNVRLVDSEQAERDADIALSLVGHRQFKRKSANLFLHKAVIDAIGQISRPKLTP